jgi:hypothetical protein
VHARIEGLEKTSKEFREARRDFNKAMRNAIVKAGESAVLPAVKARFPSRRFAQSLFIKRDRTTVFIGSRLRGTLNRAVGWLDFGGRRERDTVRRVGPHAIVEGLRQRRPLIDEAVLREVTATFSPLEHRP